MTTSQDKPNKEPEGGPLRLQLFLARAGVASRRQAEGIILAGRVTVNGTKVTELGSKVSPGDEVRLDGKRLELEEGQVYLLLNKPAGYLSSMADPEGRRLAVDLLGPEIKQRIYNVGRLDQWSRGLLLFTNDGELARRLSHPSCGLKKEYEVTTDLPLPPEFFREFRAGVDIEGVVYKAQAVEKIDAWHAVVVLVEGKNREIRRVLEHYGIRALSLTRIAFGPLRIEGLEEGRYRELSPAEVAALRDAVSPE
jgi:23S rRNA pseudouridine2605 synthase